MRSVRIHSEQERIDMARDSKGDRKSSRGKDKIVKAKACAFCKDGVKAIDYKDTNLLRKFISDRGKIRARRVTGNCTQHQRDIAMAVKNAREVALLPYTSTAR
jgi:small subunit ribosomal protein S18